MIPERAEGAGIGKRSEAKIKPTRSPAKSDFKSIKFIIAVIF